MRRQRRSFQRTLLSFIAIVLGILLAVMLSVTLYFQHLLDRVNYMEYDDSPAIAENLFIYSCRNPCREYTDCTENELQSNNYQSRANFDTWSQI